MAIRNARPITWRPLGLSDSIDGSNAFPGAMSLLQNLVPAPHTARVFVPRPASQQLDNFSSIVNPGQGEALFEVGTRSYGFVQSARFAGKSEPFIYDSATGGLVPVIGLTVGNTPNQTANTGDWTPPTIARIGGRVLFTHPGFGLPNAFGWLDMTGFSDALKTGNTHTSTTIDTLSANVLTAGWRPGMTIVDSAGDIPPATRIVSIAANGLSCVISAAATGAHTATTFTVTGGTAAAPLWCAGNLNGLPLVAVPSCVAQFSGRAYFGVANSTPFSDAGDPLQASGTTLTQVLTYQNGLTVTALKGLPFKQTIGGVLQALIVFQGAGAIQQITGDPAFQTLAVNEIQEGVGTLAPNTIEQISQLGIGFIASDGLRIIDYTGTLSEPLGLNGDGVAYPFVNAINPSRMCAAYNSDVYRVALTGNVVTAGRVQSTVSRLEYWYHVKQRIWSGPHTFPAQLIAGSQTAAGFVVLPTGATGLWESDTMPTLASSYTENGVPMIYNYETVLLPDTGEMAENAMVETALAIGISPDSSAQVSFINEAGQTLDSQAIPGLGIPPSLWGTMVWGRDLWGAGSSVFQQRRIPWSKPLVFKQGQISIAGECIGTVAIGNIYMRYQVLGYLMQGLANAV